MKAQRTEAIACTYFCKTSNGHDSPLREANYENAV